MGMNPNLTKNREFVIEILNSEPINDKMFFIFIGLIDISFRNDKELMLKAIEINETAIFYCSDSLLKNRDFIKEAMYIRKINIVFAKIEWWNDDELLKLLFRLKD